MSDNQPHRLAFFLPNSLTALNVLCGVNSIMLSWKGEVYKGALFLLLAAIFDLLDGRVARMTGTQSSFGEQFDSLCDAISFGVAPALLLYAQFFTQAGRFGAFVIFVYILCGLLRLARFNANIENVKSDFFQGLPIPGAAWGMVGLVMLATRLPQIKEWTIAVAVIVLLHSFLMISNVPFYSFKNSKTILKNKRLVLFTLFIVGGLTFEFHRVLVFCLVSLYVVGSIIYFFTHKGELKDVFNWPKDRD